VTIPQSNLLPLDTRFRSALQRMVMAGRLTRYAKSVSPDLELAAIMKKLDGGPALLFHDVAGSALPVVGNFLSCQANCEAAFGVDFRLLRDLIARALSGPLPPNRIAHAPVQEVVHTAGIDLGGMLPVLRHTSADAGHYITAGIVLVRDPETGIYNASYHRLQLIGPNQVAIKLDYGRHLRAAFERAVARNMKLPVAVCIGADLALQFTAATMGSQMPESADELAVAGALAGRPLDVVPCVSQDLHVPSEAEIILEGTISPDHVVEEGPFGEFVGFMSPQGPAPVLTISAVTHRRRPIYHAINGYGRETIMLRKYVLEASLLKVLTSAVPIVVDAEMTAGGLHRFHAVIQVRKTSRQHDGLQRNAMLAAFGALKDLDQVILVDDDIDIRDSADVDYALATRFDAAVDLVTIPGARGHEYVRAGRDGIRTKLGLDATVPFEQQARFRRCSFEDVAIDPRSLDHNTTAMSALIEG
jgi:2,5-furandicarboxylate decarboxylase 1